MPRESRKPARTFRWRLWLGIVFTGLLFVSTMMAAARVKRFMLTEPQFTFSRSHKDSLAVEGLRFTARAKVLRVFAGDFERSIFSIPLEERRRRLLGIDWVEDAAISRIWPDRLLVRIRERQPVAYVYFRNGPLLIDTQGVLLDPPVQSQFAFPVLSGAKEDESEAVRRERVGALLRVQEDLGPLAKDISELNVADLDNIRMVAQFDGRPVELILGDTNFHRRYENFVASWTEIQKSSPNVRTFDLRLDDRITAIGTTQ